jgi:hypothetical protein
MKLNKTEFTDKRTIDWLMKGDASIRWQVMKDLLGKPNRLIEKEREKISKQGWGAKLLKRQDEEGTWAGSLYSRKWISTTYTMLLLRRLGLSPSSPEAKKPCSILLDKGFYADGGINYFRSLNHSETCVTGMILSILSYFHYDDQRLESLVKFLLEQQIADGGWNCRSFKGDTHSSFHTTMSVLEGLREYEKFKKGRGLEVRKIQLAAVEFLLNHKLFRSHRTGRIFDSKMTRFSFPTGWRYDVLRGLDYFQEADIPFDNRMEEAIELVVRRKTKDGKWLVQNRHPGKTYFEMEQVGKPSRWNTLRALRVLKRYLKLNNQI